MTQRSIRALPACLASGHILPDATTIYRLSGMINMFSVICMSVGTEYSRPGLDLGASRRSMDLGRVEPHWFVATKERGTIP